MMIQTAIQPQQAEEAFSAKDITEISRIIQHTHTIYTEQLHEASFRLHQAQRSVNRATHEQHRLEKHLERIETFCEKHNIALHSEEKE